MNTKTYRALLSQTSSSDPSATVLEDTIGGIIWTRDSQGRYLGTKTAAFPANKTFLLCNPGSTADGWQAPGFLAVLYRQDNDTVVVVTQDSAGNLADGELVSAPVEISVYP